MTNQKPLKKVSLCALVTLMLTGCVHEQGGEQSLSWLLPFQHSVSAKAEALLRAPIFGGSYGDDHFAARDKVNPAQVRSRLAYVERTRRQSVMASSAFRALSLEKQSGSFLGGAYQIAALDAVSASGGVPAPSPRPSLVNYGYDYDVAQAVPVVKDAEPMKVAKVPGKVEDLAAKHDLAAFPVAVRDIRLGDYEDKTRLVFDLTAAAKFNYDLDNVSSVLTVHFDNAGWMIGNLEHLSGHPLIDRFEMQNRDSKGVDLKVVLKKPSKMLMSGFVRPEGSQGHRVFLDVAAL